MRENNPPFWGRLKELTEQVVTREGCRLYDMEFVGGSKGRGRILRVYIDRNPENVGVEDCANVSRGLNLLLDVEDVVPGEAYLLEVSSPGLERKLKEAWHFEEAVGKTVVVKLDQPIEAFNPETQKFRGARSLKGELVKVENQVAQMKHEDVELNFPLDSVERAHLVFEFVKNEKGSHKGDDKRHGKRDVKRKD
jgi:ribosome maturation factor RimP